MSDDARFTTMTQSNITELRRLRATVKSQEDTIRLLKGQYDDLAADYDNLLADSKEKLHRAYTERDRALTAESEMNTILDTAAAGIMEALRARRGDQQDEPRTGQQLAAIPRNSTVAPLHQPQNHPALRNAIDREAHGRAPEA